MAFGWGGGMVLLWVRVKVVEVEVILGWDMIWSRDGNV